MLGIPQLRPVDPVLTQYGLDFLQDRETYFAADAVYPFIATPGDTGTYYISDARNALRVENVEWSYNVGAQAIEPQFTSAAFKAKKWAAKALVTQDDERNWLAGGPGIRARAATFCAEKIYLAREARAYALCNGSSAGTTSVTGNNQWNTVSSGTANPRLDVNTGSAVILKATGRKANTVVIPGPVWDSITGTQVAGSGGGAIIQAIQYTIQALGTALTPALIAQYLNVRTVVPACAVQQDPTKHDSITVSVGLPEAGKYVWETGTGSGKRVYVMYNENTSSPTGYSYGQSFGPTYFEAQAYEDPEVEGVWVRGKSVLIEKETCVAGLNILTTVIS